MKKSNSNRYLHAIVVGNSEDDFVRHTMGLFGGYGIEYVLCGDIYQAICRLSRNGRGEVLVVGRIERLSREKGLFLQKVREKGFFCCCLAEGHLWWKGERIMAAAEGGFFVISEPAEVEDVIMKLSADIATYPLGEKEGSNTRGFNREEFLTTKAELDALLGI